MGRRIVVDTAVHGAGIRASRPSSPHLRWDRFHPTPNQPAARHQGYTVSAAACFVPTADPIERPDLASYDTTTPVMSQYPSAAPGQKTFKLNTGAEIPVVGLGTWQSAPGEVAKAVESAIKSGYRHIDCAWMYGNEHEVGQGIKAAGVPREELFITTKIWGTYQRRPEEGLDDSLKKLGLDYVDLLLVHWPVPLIIRGDEKIPLNSDGTRAIDKEWNLEKTWELMEKLPKSKVKAIGVSNCSISYLERLLSKAKIIPAANQVELHPFLPQHKLVAYCQSKGILPQAYSPLGSSGGPVLQDPLVVEIAKKHNADPAQVVISWGVQRGVTVLPKSVTPSRIETNGKLLTLSEDEMLQLNELHQQPGKAVRLISPAWGVDLEFDS
ncbi:hypothetical protein ACQY0O_005431 [Thecaphora frezii]